MSQDFNIKFEEYQENDPTENKESKAAVDKYIVSTNTRNVAFVWPDGKMQFFNYSYLVTCIHDPIAKSIIMEFTTHKVELKGINLEAMAFLLLAHIPHIIRCTEPRYNAIEDNGKPVVNSIKVLQDV